jgi:hypothetical protein
MDFELHSYRFSQEIIEHPNYQVALTEITNVVSECPLFTYPNKSSSNRRLDIVQQLFNTFFDRRLACDLGWQYHPSATNIPDSGLAADYRKEFNGLRIQAEVQFGNMARWYSDIYKFQTAYSQDLIDMGLSIVPCSEIARRMDSNVANYERCIREIPSAKLSITLPILLIGLKTGEHSPVVDVSLSNFKTIKLITGKGNVENKYRIVNGIVSGTPIGEIDENSPVGAVAGYDDEDEDES